VLGIKVSPPFKGGVAGIANFEAFTTVLFPAGVVKTELANGNLRLCIKLTTPARQFMFLQVRRFLRLATPPLKGGET